MAAIPRWTVVEYERMTELGVLPRRAELLRGVIVERTSKSSLHCFLQGGIAADLRQRAGDGLIAWQGPSLVLADSVPEPDVAIIRGKETDFRARHPTTAELVVEIAASDATLDRENASLCAEAGVPEYWIVLGEAEQIEVYRRLENGVYQEKRVYSCDETIPCASVLAGQVRVADWFE